jgi:hypothetical protein
VSEVVIDAPVIHDDVLSRAVRRAVEDEGFEPVESTATASSRRAARRSGGGPFPPWEVLLWARDHMASDVALALAAAVGRAIRRHRNRQKNLRAKGTVRVLYGPDGTELAEVKVRPEKEG